MANKHSKMCFPNRQWSARVKNVGDVEMRVGRCAIVTCIENETWVCVRMIATADAAIRQKVLGPVGSTNIAPGELGNVRIRGRHTSVWAEGTVERGDILSPHQTIAGAWSAKTTATGAGCIIAMGEIAGTYGSEQENIEGHVVTWRI